MESSQAATREYMELQHTYSSFMNHQQPVSIHQIPIPFVANHIFGIKTNPQTISPHSASLLQKIKQKHEKEPQPQQVAPVEEEGMFDIGEKQQTNDVVRLGLKGMKSFANVKSLANVSSYLSNFLSKKK